EAIVLQRRELRELALHVKQLLEERLLDRIAIDAILDEAVVWGGRGRDLVHAGRRSLRVRNGCVGRSKKRASRDFLGDRGIWNGATDSPCRNSVHRARALR